MFVFSSESRGKPTVQKARYPSQEACTQHSRALTQRKRDTDFTPNDSRKVQFDLGRHGSSANRAFLQAKGAAAFAYACVTTGVEYIGDPVLEADSACRYKRLLLNGAGFRPVLGLPA